MSRWMMSPWSSQFLHLYQTTVSVWQSPAAGRGFLGSGLLCSWPAVCAGGAGRKFLSGLEFYFPSFLPAR